MTGEWLGHRDLCELQWGQPCTCRCTAPTCPGVDRCQGADCPVVESFLPASDDQ